MPEPIFEDFLYGLEKSIFAKRCEVDDLKKELEAMSSLSRDRLSIIGNLERQLLEVRDDLPTHGRNRYIENVLVAWDYWIDNCKHDCDLSAHLSYLIKVLNHDYKQKTDRDPIADEQIENLNKEVEAPKGNCPDGLRQESKKHDHANESRDPLAGYSPKSENWSCCGVPNGAPHKEFCPEYGTINLAPMTCADARKIATATNRVTKHAGCDRIHLPNPDIKQGNELKFVCICCDGSFQRSLVNGIFTGGFTSYLCTDCRQKVKSNLFEYVKARRLGNKRYLQAESELKIQLDRARHDSESNFAAFKEVSKQLRRAIKAIRKLSRAGCLAHCPLCNGWLTDSGHTDDCETKLLEAITDKTEKNDQRGDDNESNFVMVFRCPKCNQMAKREQPNENAHCLKCEMKMENTLIERKLYNQCKSEG